MTDFKLDQQGNTGVITVKGALIIETVNDFKAALMDSLSKSEYIILDLKEVSAIDLSCLQLLYSAHLSSVRLKKKMIISDNSPDVFKKALRDSGYSHLTGFDCDDKPGLFFAAE